MPNMAFSRPPSGLLFGSFFRSVIILFGNAPGSLLASSIQRNGPWGVTLHGQAKGREERTRNRKRRAFRVVEGQVKGRAERTRNRKRRRSARRQGMPLTCLLPVGSPVACGFAFAPSHPSYAYTGRLH